MCHPPSFRRLCIRDCTFNRLLGEIEGDSTIDSEMGDFIALLCEVVFHFLPVNDVKLLRISFLFPRLRFAVVIHCALKPMTHAPETGVVNRLHSSGAGFWYACHVYLAPDSSGNRFRRRLQHRSIQSQKLACT